MSLDECEGCAACRLSEMTGRPHEEFEPDAEIPDLGEQELLIPDGGAESERRVYQVTHCAFISEYVIASSPEEASKAAVGGWDTGEYVYGHSNRGHPVGTIDELAELPWIGETTINRLLEADSPVPLGPESNHPSLPKRALTRIRNQLEGNPGWES